MQVKIHRLQNDIPLPNFATKGSVGFDLAASSDKVIKPGQIALIPTGLVIEVPSGFALILASRSSTPRKKNLIMPHSIGVIDQDYCGKDDEIKLQVKNFSAQEVLVKKGERIAQGLFVKVEQCTFIETKEITNKTRGGFGSTG